MKINNEHSLLLIGILSLAAAAVLERFLGPHYAVDFWQGLLDGLSVTIIFGTLIKTGRACSRQRS